VNFVVDEQAAGRSHAKSTHAAPSTVSLNAAREPGVRGLGRGVLDPGATHEATNPRPARKHTMDRVRARRDNDSAAQPEF
jgi:hypothetical protein